MLTSAEKKWLELKIIMGNKTQAKNHISSVVCRIQSIKKAMKAEGNYLGMGRKTLNLCREGESSKTGCRGTWG